MEVTDGRVVLRRMRRADVAPYLAAFGQEPELARLLGLERAPTARDLRRRLARVARDGSVVRTVADAGDDRFLGEVLVHSHQARHRRAELAFWLVPAARGAGIGTRALTLLVDWAFATLALERLEITTTLDNHAARGLAARLGFIEEAVMRGRNLERGRRIDVVLLALLRSDA